MCHTAPALRPPKTPRILFEQSLVIRGPSVTSMRAAACSTEKPLSGKTSRLTSSEVGFACLPHVSLLGCLPFEPLLPRGRESHCNQQSRTGIGPYPLLSSSWMSWATSNWRRILRLRNQRAAIRTRSGCESSVWRSSGFDSPTSVVRSYLGQWNRICRTVCACQPQGQRRSQVVIY